VTTAQQINEFLAEMDAIENGYLHRESRFPIIHVDAEMFDDLLDFVDGLCERDEDGA